MPTENIEELDELAADDAYKLGRVLASAVLNGRGELSYNEAVSVYVEGVGTYVLRVEPDEQGDPFSDDDCMGTLHWPGRNDEGRPSGVDGSGRKMDTRSGPVWWMPPADVKSDPKTLEACAERARRYLREDWCYVGIVLTLSIPGHEEQTTSLWRVESDPGDYLVEVIDDLATELKPGAVLENIALARTLRGWVASIESGIPDGEGGDLRDVTTDMLAMARELDPKGVSV